MNLKPLIIIGFMQVLSFPVYAQEMHEKQKDAFCALPEQKTELILHFRFDRSIVDYGYRDNKQVLNALHKIFADRLCVSRIDSVCIQAFSSPEGDAAYNRRLALRRAHAVKGYLVWKYPGLDQYRIRTAAQAESWNALREAIKNDTLLPCRKEILQILELNTTESRKEALLKKLNTGIPYQYLSRQILPRLRNASICTVYMSTGGADSSATPGMTGNDAESPKTNGQRNDDDTEIVNGVRVAKGAKNVTGGADVKDNAGTGNTDVAGNAGVTGNTEITSNTGIAGSTGVTGNEGTGNTGVAGNTEITNNAGVVGSTGVAGGADATASGKPRRRPLFALKTNLLFDAALMPNIELEVPIGKRWSLNAEYMFPWWRINDDRYCLQVLMGGLEGRYWLGKRDKREVLTGHFMGLYAGGGKYDLQWNTNGYQGEFFIAAGLSYGYAHSIARNLRLEYNIGVGMLRTNYRHYHARENHRTLLWQENGEYTWLGPTKLKISLVWLISRKTKK